MGMIIFGGFIFLLCVGTAWALLRYDWSLFNTCSQFRLGFREFKRNYWLESESYICTKLTIYYESKNPNLRGYIGMKTPIDYARYRIWVRKGSRDAVKRAAEEKLSIYRAGAELKHKEVENIGGDKE